MIPNTAAVTTNYEEESYKDKDFKINIDRNSVGGFVDGLESVKQAAYLILNVERYDYIIYSWNYGVELKELIGQPRSYVLSEVKRRVQEALLQDERIKSVGEFDIKLGKHYINATFEVNSIYGSFQQEVEVTTYV